MPQNPAADVVPWVIAGVTAVLAFIPIIGAFLGAEVLTGAVLGGVATTAAGFAAGGLQTLEADPYTNDISDIRTLGTSVYATFQNSSDALADWSSTLLGGKPDKSGRTLLDHFRNGRFALGAAAGGVPSSHDIGKFYFQIVTAKFANEQWAHRSTTFVMCANATNVPCQHTSRYTTDDGRTTCCLYSLDDSGIHYREPPAFANLTGSRYAIPAPNITASALGSYRRAKFAYDPSMFASDLTAQVSGDPRRQTFLQGASAPGVFTLPVCDVTNASWVADYSASLLPCCCGPNCSEMQAFANAANLNGSSAYIEACKKQYKAFSIKSAAGRARPVGAVAVAAVVAALVWLSPF